MSSCPAHEPHGPLNLTQLIFSDITSIQRRLLYRSDDIPLKRESSKAPKCVSKTWNISNSHHTKNNLCWPLKFGVVLHPDWSCVVSLQSIFMLPVRSPFSRSISLVSHFFEGCEIINLFENQRRNIGKSKIKQMTINYLQELVCLSATYFSFFFFFLHIYARFVLLNKNLVQAECTVNSRRSNGVMEYWRNPPLALQLQTTGGSFLSKTVSTNCSEPFLSCRSSNPSHFLNPGTSGVITYR